MCERQRNREAGSRKQEVQEELTGKKLRVWNHTGNRVKKVNISDREGQIHKEVILSKRLQSLGWKAKTSFAEGMILSYKYYVDNGNKW